MFGILGAQLAPTLAEISKEVRELAARGQYSAARAALVDLQQAARGTDFAAEIPQLVRTLEVLESIDVVRNLMRTGNQEAASEASSRILDRLSDDDYAELGAAAAAVTLLSRAGELSRRRDGAEIDAFV